MKTEKIIAKIVELEKKFEEICQRLDELENYYDSEKMAERERDERLARRIARSISLEQAYARRIVRPTSEAEFQRLVQLGILPPGEYIVLELSEDRYSFEYGGLVPLDFSDNDRGGRKTMFRPFKGNPFS